MVIDREKKEERDLGRKKKKTKVQLKKDEREEIKKK